MSVVADRGRRRRRLDDEGEDEVTENAPVVARPSECESEGEGPEVELSEYESAVDESADQEDETEEGSGSETEEGSDTEETGSETETEGGYTDEEGLEEERQSGDGEEQPDNGKPDDDEDKKNPAYVPRKGAFYEHDFRQGDETVEGEEGDELKPKKKLWQDEGKWSHDRYIDDMQAPKSREELIALYGYDIRASDKPPEAPPRRMGRGGKGPRKQRVQDFMPRMAVIDTTEDGSDSVPNLGDEELILYNEPPHRQSRNNNNRNNRDNRRGGRGGGNFRGGDVAFQNSRNSSENTNRSYDNRNNQGSRRYADVPPQDAKTLEDFPALDESAKQYSEKRSENYEKLRADVRPNSERGQRPYQSDNRDNRRGEYRDEPKGRFQGSQDIRRQDDGRGNNRTQQGYRDDRRGGYNNRSGGRDSNYNRGIEENWRAAPSQIRDNYTRNEDFGGNGRGGQQDYGYNKRQPPQYGGGDNRGPRMGNSGDTGGYSGPNRRGNRGYEQPPRYQQQQQSQVPPETMAGSGREPREYTNSSYRATDDKSKVRTTHNAAAASATVNDSGDGANTSSSKNVVISNKENVQTINVTITSTTTEKKSYAKERRAKGASRPVDGGMMMGASDPQSPVTSVPGSHYQTLPPGGGNLDTTSAPLAGGAKRYSSQRQQGMGKSPFTEPPPTDASGANLYNPAMPPPSFFQREHGTVAPGQRGAVPAGQLPASSSPAGVQEAAHFTPALLPPAAALPFGLPGVPVSSSGLALPPNAAGIPTNPAMFQPPTGPPPTSIPAPGAALMAPPYLPAGMMYGGAPRVPPPGTPAAFPLSMAYTSPPPPTTVGAKVVGSQPPPQGTTTQQAIPSTGQHKKVYRGDITYYAPELQQPSRTPQKRPKAAIPIVDPQEIRKQKQKEKAEQRSTPEKSSTTPSKHTHTQSASSVSNNDNTGTYAPAQQPRVVESGNQEAFATMASTSLSSGGRDPKTETSSSITPSSAQTKAEPKLPVSSQSRSSPLKDTKSDSSSTAKPIVSAESRDLSKVQVKTEVLSPEPAGVNGSVPQGKSALPTATESFKSDIVNAETLVDVTCKTEVKGDVAASLPEKLAVKKEIGEQAAETYQQTPVQSSAEAVVKS